jgi:hypothetical protein
MRPASCSDFRYATENIAKIKQISEQIIQKITIYSLISHKNALNN